MWHPNKLTWRSFGDFVYKIHSPKKTIIILLSIDSRRYFIFLILWTFWHILHILTTISSHTILSCVCTGVWGAFHYINFQKSISVEEWGWYDSYIYIYVYCICIYNHLSISFLVLMTKMYHFDILYLFSWIRELNWQVNVFGVLSHKSRVSYCFLHIYLSTKLYLYMWDVTYMWCLVEHYISLLLYKLSERDTKYICVVCHIIVGRKVNGLITYSYDECLYSNFVWKLIYHTVRIFYPNIFDIAECVYAKFWIQKYIII